MSVFRIGMATLAATLLVSCAVTHYPAPDEPQLVKADACTGAGRQGWCGKSPSQVMLTLRAINYKAGLRMRPGEDCKDHALYAWDEARAQGYTATQYIFTCPYGIGDACHEALYIDAGPNGRYVLDNGYLLHTDAFPYAVGPVRDFVMRADGPTVIADDEWEATAKLRALSSASAR